MADIQADIAGASQDLQTIEDFVNLPAGSDVRPRLLPSVNVGTLAGARQAIFEAGGLPATPFATKALMTASTLVDGDYAQVTDDTVNNGLYVKTAGAWVKSGYDPVVVANTYTDNKVKGFTNNFKTKALMTASALPNDSYAMITDDTEANNGWYSKVAGVWVKATYDPLAQAKIYADTNKLDLTDITYSYEGGNLIGAKSARYDDFGVSSTLVLTATSTYKSVVIPVNEGDELFIHNNRNSFSGTIGAKFAFFALDPFLNQSQTAITASATSVSDGVVAYQKTTVPVGANYLILNTKHGTNEHTWAVHKDALNPSFDSGEAFVSAINGVELPVGVTFDSLEASVFADGVVNTATQNAKVYADENKIDYTDLGYSYTGDNKINAGTRLYEGFALTGLYKAENNSFYDAYVLPVNSGDVLYIFNDAGSYSGTNGGGIGFFPTDPYVNQGQTRITATPTQITDPDSGIRYNKVTVPSSAKFLVLNKEYRASAQTYEYVWAVQKDKFTPEFEAGSALISSIGGVAIAGSNSSGEVAPTDKLKPQFITNFVELNKVRPYSETILADVTKNVSPVGIAYKVKGAVGVDSASNTLFAKIDIAESGTQSLNVHLMKLVDDYKALGVLKAEQFTVPSGQLDNPDSFSLADKYPNDMYVHPSIAYDPVGVAGFKYWMAASVYPPTAEGGSLWEDEDLFVSNDAKNWQRIRSMYETDKSYTTAQLRLPPHSLVTNSARKHAFLPSPIIGDTFEVSIEAMNGKPKMDREMITLNANLPWKHDPFVLIDGGYVYVYNTFHLPTLDRDGGKNRFIICARTNDGINWHSVRSDGSTMLITEASSKLLFTKDEQGRYNYFYGMYNVKGSNPEIIKYGDGDYEMIYGTNFARRHKGTSPYSFDFSTSYPIQDLGSGNHPTSMLKDGVLYVINNTGLYSSTDRGETFTKFAHYPAWLGGVEGLPYKKTWCIGEGGKLILYDVQRVLSAGYELPPAGAFTKMNDINRMYKYEYPSFTDFINKAQDGLVDAYIDLQVCKVNYGTKSRKDFYFPTVTLTTIPASGTLYLQRVDVTNFDVEKGDTLFVYATLNSRNGAEIQFGGIDLA